MWTDFFVVHISVFDRTNCQILGNVLHDCGTAGNKEAHLIYYGNNGLRIDNPGVTATVSNNTAYGNGAQGSTGNYGIYVQLAAQANLSKNLVVNNVGGGINADSPTYFGTVNHNGYYQDAVCTADTAPVSGNPQFVNVSAGNFQLSSARALRWRA